jgi:rare lipoprotein A
MRTSISAAAAAAAFLLAGAAYAAEPEGYEAEGGASWYGAQFHGRKTASGETFDMGQRTAAHRTLPLGSWVAVTNLDNDRTVQVRINDRGPFKPNRIIDLSRAAAEELGFRAKGIANVRVRYLGTRPGELRPMIVAEAPEAVAPSPAEPAAYAVAEAAAPEIPSAEAHMVVAPPPPPVAAQGAFALQVGAFSKAENAERAKAAIAAFGAVTTKALAVRGSTLQRVMVGAFATEAEAKAALPDLARAGFGDAQVVRLK